jgi:hypothetical protein
MVIIFRRLYESYVLLIAQKTNKQLIEINFAICWKQISQYIFFPLRVRDALSSERFR